jgi:hypothetical protein
MTDQKPASSKGLARTLGIAFLAFVALPVLAFVTVGMRFLIPVVIVVAAAAALFSPSFRRWFR